jgi:DNA-binding MarR family transcriptional regulator
MDNPLHGFGEAAIPVAGIDGSDALNPLTAVKLWDNPCWLSFRINYLALNFNLPIYGWIEAQSGLKRPEFVVLYSLKLKDGVAARDVCQSSGFPKNTISRAIQILLKRQLIRRAADASDRRSFVLRLTDTGRRLAEEAMPAMLERERLMLGALTPAERHMLFELLGKMVIDSPNWPVQMGAADNAEELS